LLQPLLLGVGKEITEEFTVGECSKSAEELIVELEFVRTLQANMVDTFEKLQQTWRTLIRIYHCA
jgi:hypothetical protein